MKILWTHNFDPAIKNSGIFMHQYAQGLKDFGIQIELFYTGALDSVSNCVKVRQSIKNISKKFDIVHAQFGSACSLVTSGALSKKIVTLRGSDWYRYKGNTILGSLHSVMATTMTRHSIMKYDTVVVVSARMRQEIEKDFAGARIYTIPSPINLQLFKPIDRNFARKKIFKTDDNGIFVLFTTMNENNPIKRLWLAKKAIEIASNEFDSIELKVASGIPHNLMPLFVCSCDIALSTSVHEGWPNSLKEAMACNVPFVSTDVSDLIEIVRAEPSCRVVDPVPESIAKNICEILKNKKKTNLRKHIEHMDMERICRKLIKTYKLTLEN